MRAGFIGLGTMGWHMAGHLAGKGLLAAVWNRTPDKAATFARLHNVEAAATPADLWKTCDACCSTGTCAAPCCMRR